MAITEKSMHKLTNPLAWILTFFVLLFIYSKFFGPIPFSVNSVTTTKSSTFDVTGEGKATAKPDIAILNVGIQASSASVKAVQDQINTVTNKVSQALKQQGIDSKDIQTTGYNISPNIDFKEGSQKIKGFSASTNLSIKVRDIDKVNLVIDTATGSGANQIGGVTFDIDDKTKVENEARQKAVAEAKKKAEGASKIAGFKLGKIINYSENFGEGPRPIPLRAASQGSAEAAIPTLLEPGSTEVTVNVTLSYEIL